MKPRDIGFSARSVCMFLLSHTAISAVRLLLVEELIEWIGIIWDFFWRAFR